MTHLPTNTLLSLVLTFVVTPFSFAKQLCEKQIDIELAALGIGSFLKPNSDVIKKNESSDTISFSSAAAELKVIKQPGSGPFLEISVNDTKRFPRYAGVSAVELEMPAGFRLPPRGIRFSSDCTVEYITQDNVVVRPSSCNGAKVDEAEKSEDAAWKSSLCEMYGMNAIVKGTPAIPAATSNR